jgi:hypothetical protein
MPTSPDPNGRISPVAIIHGRSLSLATWFIALRCAARRAFGRAVGVFSHSSRHLFLSAQARLGNVAGLLSVVLCVRLHRCVRRRFAGRKEWGTHGMGKPIICLHSWAKSRSFFLTTKRTNGKLAYFLPVRKSSYLDDL